MEQVLTPFYSNPLHIRRECENIIYYTFLWTDTLERLVCEVIAFK